MLGILGETKHLFNEFYDSFSVDSKFQSPYPKRAYLNELDTPPIQLTILVKSFANTVLVFLLCPPPPKTARCVGYQTLGTRAYKRRVPDCCLFYHSCFLPCLWSVNSTAFWKWDWSLFNSPEIQYIAGGAVRWRSVIRWPLNHGDSGLRPCVGMVSRAVPFCKNYLIVWLCLTWYIQALFPTLVKGGAKFQPNNSRKRKLQKWKQFY